MLLLGTGCNAVFGLHDVLPQDATVRPDAVGCSGVRFQAASNLAVPLGDSPGDGELYDPLRLWFTQADANSHRRIYMTSRAAPDAAFDPPVLATVNSTAGDDDDDDPALTADGLDVFFVSTRGSGKAAVYEAVRASTAEPFGPALTIPQTSDLSPFLGIDVSWDGLTLYVTDPGPSTVLLYELHRATRDDPFSPPSAAIADDVTWPTVSPDGKELFFVRRNVGGVRRLVRADPTFGTPFTVPAMDDVIDATASDPDVSPDAGHLVVWTGSGFALYARSCP